jgi:hypothetical protein
MGSSSGTVVTIHVPDDVLADIDAEAKKRTQFILNATRAALIRLKRGGSMSKLVGCSAKTRKNVLQSLRNLTIHSLTASSESRRDL